MGREGIELNRRYTLTGDSFFPHFFPFRRLCEHSFAPLFYYFAFMKSYYSNYIISSIYFIVIIRAASIITCIIFLRTMCYEKKIIM